MSWRVLPAYAGMIRNRMVEVEKRDRAPRVCGDDPPSHPPHHHH